MDLSIDRFADRFDRLSTLSASTWRRGDDLLVLKTPFPGVSFVLAHEGRSVSFSETFYRVEPDSRFYLRVNGMAVKQSEPIHDKNYRVGEYTRDSSAPLQGNSLIEVVEREGDQVIFWVRALLDPIQDRMSVDRASLPKRKR